MKTFTVIRKGLEVKLTIKGDNLVNVLYFKIKYPSDFEDYLCNFESTINIFDKEISPKEISPVDQYKAGSKEEQQRLLKGFACTIAEEVLNEYLDNGDVISDDGGNF